MEKAVSMSPVPKATKKENKAVNFCEAVKEITNGKKVHKLEWEDRGFYGIIDEGVLKLHKPDGKLYSWVLNDGDLIGEDYITI